MGIDMTYPKQGDGFWADVEHLRLFSEVTTLGWASAVFDKTAKGFVGREWATDSEDGKRKAVRIAEIVLKKTLRAVDWKQNPNH